MEQNKHSMPENKKKQQRLFLPKENSDHDPLEIYLKEIRKTQLLNHQEETYWATIVWNEKNNKIKLFKKAVGILRSLEHQNPLNRLLILNKKSIHGYINLKNAILLQKKLAKTKNQFSKAASPKEKNRLAKDQIKLESALSSILLKIDASELNEWPGTIDPNHKLPDKKTKRLQKIWGEIKLVEPKLKEARQKLRQINQPVFEL